MSTDLVSAVLRYTDRHGGGDALFPTAIPGLEILRCSRETEPHRMVYKPSLCVVVQGGKQIRLGEQEWEYGAMQSLVISIEMPAVGRVKEASADKPFLGLIIDLDAATMRDVMGQLDAPPRPAADGQPAVFVQNIEGALADCVLRLVRMLDTPAAIAVLHPSVMREICFWLLTGPHAGEVCKLALPDSHTQRIARAIRLLRDHYVRALRVEELAESAGMSASSFHQHFKALTSMTPLQFQKQLRLLEARRLMVADAVNVSDAAYRVGYESASQFSREYARMFGMPPKRDAMGMQAMPLAA
jgi:AraC-like DNA-binding protein